MPIVRKSLLQLVFSGCYMKRWNDKFRPMELVEVDKQAHKMIAAWVLVMLNSEDMAPGESLALADEVVRGGIADYLYRLVITDIKPPVFYRIKENPEHYRQLSAWVLDQLRPRIMTLGSEFTESMETYLLRPEHDTLAGKILSAAHLYASYSEFMLLKPINEMDEELRDIEQSFINGLSELSDIRGVSELVSQEGAMARFVRMCGQLRFQKRWSQTPRIPETTVLGHMFIVACYAWFFSLETGTCAARAHNNFFAGLFHDLPELLTRDIISPVKRSAEPIGQLIKEYEEQELERRVLAPLNKAGLSRITERLSYLLGLEVGSEFTACHMAQGRPEAVSTEELNQHYNENRFDPKDGEMLKLCDNLAAFIEAYTALRNGIASDQLHEATWRLRKHYQQNPAKAGINIGALLADFD